MNYKQLFSTIPEKRPVIIAGPCSAESEEQVLTTAKALAEQGIKIFRAGIWKPRTKPNSFEGVGAKGLAWLSQVKAATGMKVATEAAMPKHVEEALRHSIDLLWIGARTTTNPFAMQEIAEALRGVDIPVLVKNPVIPDLDLWTGGLERLQQAGISRLGVIHRGFSVYGNKLYRNRPHWQLPVELRRRMPDLLFFCDPSHIGGQRNLIAPIAQQAMDMNFDGLMIEAHCCPDKALSDKKQQLTPQELQTVVQQLVIRDTAEINGLSLFRNRIDEIDNRILELLANRMEISKEIGEYKKAHNLSILQSARYKELVERMRTNAQNLGLDADFVQVLAQLIHEQSSREQMKVMNSD
ncbi:MAG: bifunctional 3-deoxy-7-phosphoheptulonate synthase/chorismate mutase type II [Bacteroidales bacterium]|nr:bifunctional 3-deoxy-7-phosphoheptulonate synthase/chorismate mutase type II [Bacteroidales bacterium]